MNLHTFFPERGERIRDRFGLVLVLLVTSFIAQGFDNQPVLRALAAVLQLAAFTVIVLATGMTRDYRVLSTLTVASIAGFVLVAVFGSTTVAAGVGALVSAFVLLVMIVAVLQRVLHHRQVSAQTLFGAVCVYVLLGSLFGAVYAVLDSFGNAPVFGESVGRSVYSYFSFVTMTTVGYGDYTAKTDLARRIAVMEAVIGQVFIATTLARLVALYKSAPPAEP
ncbi:MAG: potassium channel family protein [Acidimicrobiales bacterium]